MSFKPDILIRSPEGIPIAIVEIKNLADIDTEAATDLRNDMLQYGLSPEIPYFLLISQEKGFLWKRDQPGALDTSPTVEFSMEEIISRYHPDVELRRRLRENELELLLLRWLNNLAWMSGDPKVQAEEELQRIGFIEDIRKSDIEIETSLYTA